MKLKSLQDTYIYKQLNSGNQITNSITHALQHGIQIDKTNLEEPFIVINKNFKFPLKYPVLKALEEGDIILMRVEGKPLPPAMPFFLTKLGNKVVAVISISTYGTFRADTKQVDIDPKTLYCLLEGAYIARKMTLDVKGITSRAASLSSEIYARMFVRILNKKYALNTDRSKMNKVIFIVSKFFLINILGLANDSMTTNYAMKNCVQVNQITIRELDDNIDPSVYTSLPNLIQFLEQNGFSGLTVRGFMEQWIYMFGPAALLSLESYPYFIYNINSVTTGSYINNQYILEDIVGQNGSKIYVDLANNYSTT